LIKYSLLVASYGYVSKSAVTTALFFRWIKIFN